MSDIERRYAALLFRRNAGNPAAMAADDAQLAQRAHAALGATTGEGWTPPTPAQAQAGQYDKPLLPWQGLSVRIENPAGTVRQGVDEGGQAWRTEFRFAYGEIEGTTGVDGDPVDVFVGPYPAAPEVYIVRQMRRKKWDEYDEDKCMIDFPSLEAARAAYLGHYDDPRFFGGIVAMPVDEFVHKVQATKDRPAMIKALMIFPRGR